MAQDQESKGLGFAELFLIFLVVICMFVLIAPCERGNGLNTVSGFELAE